MASEDSIFSDNIYTIRVKVKAGLKMARQYVEDNPELLRIVDALERTWDFKVSTFVLEAVGLSAFRFRNREQTIKALQDVQNQIQTTGIPEC